MLLTDVPLAAYLSFSPLRDLTGSRSTTAASVACIWDQGLPTSVSDNSALQIALEANAVELPSLDSLGWMDLSRAVFGNSRNLEPWEREALDDFTWSELQS